jgi:outer membrane lipoprotein-sorting protein
MAWAWPGRGRARWAVPVGGVATAGLVLAGTVVAGAQPAPSLPHRMPQQLLAAVATAKPPKALTGTIQESASFGLPSLPALGSDESPLSAQSLLSGSHTINFWYGGPGRIRLALPVQLGEADLRQNGRSVWIWDSRSNQATHITLPARAAHSSQLGPGVQAGAGAVPTPSQAARQALAAAGKTTSVSTGPNTVVAGQDAYQLYIAPRQAGSLISRITIAIAAHGALPLRVQVFARGMRSPAFQVGFSSLSYARPAASNFRFSPPPRAKVKNVTVPASPGAIRGVVPLPQRLPRVGGKVTLLPAGHLPSRAEIRRIEASMLKHLPRNMPKAQRAAFINGIKRMLRNDRVHPFVFRNASPFPPAMLPAGAPRVLGKGWLSVLVLPAPGMMRPMSVHVSAGSGAASYSPAGTITVTGPPGPAGQLGALSQALLRAATPVHGSWGSGRLLRTSLFSVLMTSNGRVLVGAVTPHVLYADAAQVK